jgi:hypothetical protein
MQKSSLLIWGAVILAVLVAIGQESEQSWKMKPNGNWDSVQFWVHRFRPGSNMTWSSGVPLSRFHNLSMSLLERGGRTQFEYVTDAGKLVCKGSFSFNSGAGSFVFVPNPDFSSELRSLGFGTPDQDQMFNFLLHDVSMEFARAVRDAVMRPSVAQLLELRNHGVNAEYLRSIKDSGYELSADDVITLRNHGVSADFLRDLKRADYDLTANEIVELRQHGVSAEYVRDLKSFGLHPRAADLVQFHMHGVSSDYLSDLKSAGYGELTADQIVQLRQHGVPAEFALRAQELGYKFTPDELVMLRQHGVNGDYLQTLKQSGIRPLTAEQITRLRQHGVD